MFKVKSHSVSKFLVPALALGALIGGVRANAQVNATFGFVPLGNTTANNSNLSLATSLTVPALEVVNTVPPTYMGQPNDFLAGPLAVSLGSQVTLSSLTLSNGSLLGITFTSASGTLTFAPTTAIMFQGSSNAAGNFLAFSEVGTLSGAGITTQNAELAGNFNQTASGGAINGSFTFSTPPTAVPEPGAVAMLVGMGTTGLGLVARRRRK